MDYRRLGSGVACGFSFEGHGETTRWTTGVLNDTGLNWNRRGCEGGGPSGSETFRLSRTRSPSGTGTPVSLDLETSTDCPNTLDVRWVPLSSFGGRYDSR